MDIYTPTAITQTLKKHGLSPNKRLGQNFLCDENIVNAIAEAAVTAPFVIEIGPGLGVLTRALARRAEKVIAIEIDAGMVRALSETLSDAPNVTVLHADILKTDLTALGRSFGAPLCVAGNLPYYITSKCLMLALETGLPITGFTAMVQKEVAERLAARPGDESYGALTAQVDYFGGAEKLFDVSRHCFYPQPDVDSAVVRIVPRPLEAVPREEYASVVKALFAMRRKTVSNNLAKGFSLTRAEAEAILAEAGVSAQIRAEELSREEFVAIAAAMAARR